MNAERLYDILTLVSGREDELQIQGAVDRLYQQIQQLSGNPQDTGIQNELASTMAEIRVGLERLEQSLSPADAEYIREMGGAEMFSTQLHTSLSSIIQQNAMTPAAAVAAIRSIQRKRSEFLARARETVTGLFYFGFDSEFLEGEENAPYIGFQIPRAIFDNELGSLSKEIAVLDRITRWFSECATGRVETPKLKALATSDPTISLSVSVATIVAIGGAITWLLNTWKQVLEIKDLHQSAKSLGFNEKDLAVFEKKISEVVEASIKKHSTEILRTCNADAGRKNEIKSGITWSMHALLERIERGMTVEIKFLPKTAPEGEEADPNSNEAQQEAEIKRLVDGLVFPAPSGEPLLALSDETGPDLGEFGKSSEG